MTQLPDVIKEFSQYMLVVKGRLPRTVEQYEIDLMLFFKFIKATDKKQLYFFLYFSFVACPPLM